MRYVVAVDGGGSTVRAAVIDEKLTFRSVKTGKAVNPNTVGQRKAATALRTTINAALRKAKIDHKEIVAVGAGVAGTAQPPQQQWLRETLTSIVPNVKIVTAPDYEIALIGAFGKRQGILILSGTGSLVYGVNSVGQSMLFGGWGYLLGDEGSGAWIGFEALRHITAQQNFGQPPDVLTMSILAKLKLNEPRELIGWMYDGNAPEKAASLAPLVVSLAEGDQKSRVIVTEAVGWLKWGALTVANHLKVTGTPYALAGGLLSEPNFMTKLLCETLELHEKPKQFSPMIGAAIMAFEALDK